MINKRVLFMFMVLVLLVPLILSSVNFEPNSVRSEFLAVPTTSGSQSFNFDQWTGSSFEINSTGTGDVKRDIFLQGVAVKALASNAACTGSLINVTIYQTSSGVPTNILTRNISFHGNNLNNTEFEWINVSMPVTTLRNNTQYALIFHTNSTTSECRLNLTQTQADYVNGDLLTSNDNGTTFQKDLNNHILFYIYGNNTVPPNLGVDVLLEQPPNGNVTADSSASFVCSGLDVTAPQAVNITNVSFFLWSSNNSIFNQTDRNLLFANSTTGNETFTIGSLSDDNYNWNCLYSNIENVTAFSPINFSYSVDTIAPIINITNIVRIYGNVTVPLNYSLIESNPSTCEFSLNNGITNTSFSTCGENATIEANPGDNTITVFVRDALGNTARDQENFTALKINTINQDKVRETSTELFSLQVINGSSTLISAIFTYNDTQENFDTTTANGTTLFINKSFQIPLIDTIRLNKTFVWNATFQRDNDFANVSFIGSQITEKIDFQLCNATLNVPYINFTFKDETVDINVDGHFNPARFTYSLTEDLTINRTLNFVDTTDRSSFSFCFSPSNETLFNKAEIDYLNETVQQRNFRDSLTLTNITTNKTLFLLATSDGIFVTFQIINTAEQNIQGVTVTAEREIGGTFELLEIGDTDDAGAVTFFLNPNKAHRMTFVKSGFETLVQTITPTQSVFTITLGSLVVSNDTNFYQGINLFTLPRQDVLQNRTLFNFTFGITSGFFVLTEAGFTLANESGFQLGTATCTTATGCNSTLSNQNTFNHTKLIMHYFWNIDGNLTNFTRTWIVTDAPQGVSRWEKLKVDLENVAASFGTGTNASFTKAVIAFLVILFLTAAVALESGIRSPLAIAGMITALTGFFDLLGWLPTLGVPFFPTIVMALIAFAIFLRGGRFNV